jgi:hypothetical protein
MKTKHFWFSYSLLANDEHCLCLPFLGIHDARSRTHCDLDFTHREAHDSYTTPSPSLLCSRNKSTAHHEALPTRRAPQPSGTSTPPSSIPYQTTDDIMGKLGKTLLAFIENVPDSRLEGGFTCVTKTIWRDADYRLDMQAITTDEPRCWNLQVQINKGGRFTSGKIAGRKGASVAMAQVPIQDPFSAATIRRKLTESAIEHGKKTGQF